LENARRTLLSVIVHGRNDTHGHNLHKRVALSLNCIAQLLAQDDEIIFVDWNTPDELPTLIEAIADKLTQACRQHLRILRVRPRQHRRFSQLTHLPVLDAVARNVAIRHCRESSRWVLSTTTDVILAPAGEREPPDGAGRAAGPVASGAHCQARNSRAATAQQTRGDRGLEPPELGGAAAGLRRGCCLR